MKKALQVLSLIYITLLSQDVLSQADKNYAFTSNATSVNQSNVRSGSDLVRSGDYLFFIASDNKVHAMKWQNLQWTGGSQALNSSAPTVSSTHDIVVIDDKVYYVAATDNKIYELSLSGSSWNYNVTVSGMNQVRANTELQVFGSHIYYVNTNNKICDINHNGTTWTGGLQLVWTPTQDVMANTQILPTSNHVYFIGNNRKIYDVVYVTGQGWQHGNWPLDVNAPLVNANNLSIANNGNHLFYVGDNGRVHELLYNGGWTGQQIWLPNPSSVVLVRSGSKLKHLNGRVYYIGTNNLMCSINFNNGWSGGQALYSGSHTVRAGSDFDLFLKNVPIEGTTSSVEIADHLIYIDANGRVCFLIYDDAIRPFRNLDCSISETNVWHFGALDQSDKKVSVSFNKVHIYEESFSYVDSYSDIYDANRDPRNPISKAGYSLTFNDEFDDNQTDLQKWGYQWPYLPGHGLNPDPNTLNEDASLAYNRLIDLTNNPISNNITESNGIATIETKWDPGTYLDWNWNKWTGSCNLRAYNYTSGTLNSGGVNIDIFNPTTPHNQFYSCGPPAQEPTMEQAYGYFEIRCSPPRGQDMWSAFWLLTNDKFIDPNHPCSLIISPHVWYPPEIDIFEIEGNGKVLLNNNIYRKYYQNCECNPQWIESCTDKNNGVHQNIEYAVGYRFTEEYMTYALNWEPNKLEFLLNNEIIYTVYDDIPFVTMYMMINTYITNHWANPFAHCEPEIFPNTYDIDYVRVYKKDPVVIWGESEPNVDEKSNITNNYRVSGKDGRIALIESKSKEVTPYHYQIFNMNGQIIGSGTSSSNKVEIELPSTGIYIVKVGDQNNQPTVKKLFIQ